MPVWTLADPILVAANVAFWLVNFVAVGWIAARAAPSRLASDGPVLRLRRFETRGRWYERRLAIGRWKDRLPEAGEAFGGASKRHIVGRSDEALAGYAAETRRAERAHWSSLLALPLTALWNPAAGVAVMVAFGVAFNAPFIAVQRYNRARIVAIVAARSARATRGMG